MSDFKERLVEEQEQLEDKLIRLNLFNESEEADKIDPVADTGWCYVYL